MTARSGAIRLYTLYNGSAGEVTGMDAGAARGRHGGGRVLRAAIYYTVDTAAENIVPAIRATADGSRDEKPQLTTVGGQFVLGWSSVRTHHWRGAARRGSARVRQTARRSPASPESLQRHGDPQARSTARFARAGRRAESLDGADRPVERACAGKDKNDVIRGRFVMSADGGLVSSAPSVAALPHRTRPMDACVTGSGGGICAVMQGHDVPAKPENDTVSYSYELNGKTYTGTGTIPADPNLFSAAGTFTDAVESFRTTVDYTTLAADSYVPVSFTVSNQGHA